MVGVKVVRGVSRRRKTARRVKISGRGGWHRVMSRRRPGAFRLDVKRQTIMTGSERGGA